MEEQISWPELTPFVTVIEVGDLMLEKTDITEAWTDETNEPFEAEYVFPCSCGHVLAESDWGLVRTPGLTCPKESCLAEVGKDEYTCDSCGYTTSSTGINWDIE